MIILVRLSWSLLNYSKWRKLPLEKLFRSILPRLIYYSDILGDEMLWPELGFRPSQNYQGGTFDISSGLFEL